MKLKDLKKIIKNNDNGVIKVKDDITQEYFVVSDVEIDVQGDLLIKIV